jgi:fructuronate reductase
VDRLAIPLAAWMRVIRLRAASGEKIVDPLADKLLEVAATCTGDAKADVATFLALDTVFPPAMAEAGLRGGSLEKAYAELG